MTDEDEGSARSAQAAAKPKPARAAKKAPSKATTRAGEAPNPPAKPAVAAPSIATELDYESLTLAQLRARMTSLSVTDLKSLLAYEESAKARAPFQTLLANRITRATAK